MKRQSLLDEALESWAYARRGVVAEVRNIPPGAFEFRPTDASRALAELVRHIVASGLMMAGELTRPDGDFSRQSFERFMKEYAGSVGRHRTKAQLLTLLTRTHAEAERKFRQAGEVSLLQQITRFDGLRGTRLAWMYHGIAHEEYHRGQIALYARLMGRVPALTKLIHG
jgi:uncharacterized damage-inducible protein DinB